MKIYIYRSTIEQARDAAMVYRSCCAVWCGGVVVVIVIVCVGVGVGVGDAIHTYIPS